MAQPTTREWRSTLTVWSPDALDAADRELLREAHEAASKAYAPYSLFQVGGAVRLEDGTVVRGEATGSVRAVPFEMELPEYPKTASFFGQQEGQAPQG